MAPVVRKAFVSSTYEDLKEHRAHVIAAIRKAGIHVDPMEDWTAESDEPKKFSQDRVIGCDLCILLVALRRGYVPPGGDLSITQLEYQAAMEEGIEVLVYLLDEQSPWPYHFVELDKDPGLKVWRTSLMERHGTEFFGLEPSSIDVSSAIARWVEKQSHKATKVGDDWIQLVSNLLDLPNNEPETWTVAADLLPHALEAVERAYTARSDPISTKEHKLTAAESAMSRPVKTLLADARDYYQDSKQKYRRTCLVMMPLGRKRIQIHSETGGVEERETDFDYIYKEIFEPAINAAQLPPPEEAVLQAKRIDAELLADGYNHDMHKALEFSRFAIADITGFNPNVFYELGLRHRARESGTMIVRQEGVPIPFDISQIKAFQYSYDKPNDLEASRRLITLVIETSLRRGFVDSPAHLALGSRGA